VAEQSDPPAEPGDYERCVFDEATGKYVSYKGNFIADDNAMINWLTPEELESFSDAERTANEGEEALNALIRKVLARELPGWQDQLAPERDRVAFATAWELMQPEEVSHGEEIGNAWVVPMRSLRDSELSQREEKAARLDCDGPG
jgi:hypothetical protein